MDPYSLQLINISKQACIDEEQALKNLQKNLKIFEEKSATILHLARKYIEPIRANTQITKIEAFINEYGLNNEEGITIISLAESLLRIPDKPTSIELIADKFSGTNWKQHLNNESFLVNAATWGLLIGGKILNKDYKENIIENLVKRLGEPIIRYIIRQAILTIGDSFVAGESIDQALKNASKYPDYLFSYEILGEGARSRQQADDYFHNYIKAINTIAKKQPKDKPLFKRTSISLKLSALHPRYELIKHNRLKNELVDSLKEIILKAKLHGINVTFAAEEASRLDISLAIFKELFSDPDIGSYEGLGITVQAYQKRAPLVIDYLRDLAKDYNKKIPIRLVKGEYWDSEIKKAQNLGLEGFPVYTYKHYTELSYLACVQKLCSSEYFYPQFATHNAVTIASIINIAKGKDFEIQRFFGMGEKLHAYIKQIEDVDCRIHAPIGNHKDLSHYLIRRLIENGSTNFFVHLFSNKSVDIDDLLLNPLILAKQTKFKSNDKILLPKNLYRSRKNSSGVDIGMTAKLSELQEKVNSFKDRIWTSSPIINGKGRDSASPLINYQPGNLKKEVGKVTFASKEDCSKALQDACRAFITWNKVTVCSRKEKIFKFADLLEENKEEFISLLIRESGKTLNYAIAEIREAVDFCRYYGIEAEKLQESSQALAGPIGEKNSLSLNGKGVFACISPWNFPLSIFVGQIIAAISMGNCVIAKPAGKTSLIAFTAVKLMHKAGIPENVVQLMPGNGEVIGNYLLNDIRIKGVAFTGSSKVAKIINRTLAARDTEITPLIAETGYQNCMVVDSSALIEQAIDDIISSAFGSTGQRCSALRVLYIQDDIADKLINLLAGAINELTIGDNEQYFTDIGPVIDQSSKDDLLKHIENMKQNGKIIGCIQINSEIKELGHYISPYAFEINSIKQLDKENFGPILHVIRYSVNDLDKIIDEINSTGLDLIFGIHSRINNKIEYIKQRIKSGNIYINRAVTGALIGMQPFSNEGTSGTWPKAGGAHYLLKFCNEQVSSENTAAIGSNLELFVS
jgi:RHH-type proline utilization regulon transcriptional repressor/proline dehydrogenase/delta 1-pyrroline-5-carboxylate dehydrogenase